jgi:hypothetical protein
MRFCLVFIIFEETKIKMAQTTKEATYGDDKKKKKKRKIH